MGPLGVAGRIVFALHPPALSSRNTLSPCLPVIALEGRLGRSYNAAGISYLRFISAFHMSLTSFATSISFTSTLPPPCSEVKARPVLFICLFVFFMNLHSGDLGKQGQERWYVCCVLQSDIFNSLSSLKATVDFVLSL